MGETILLFNSSEDHLHKSNEKVISIKNLSEIKQSKKLNEKEVNLSNHETIQDQIEQKQQELLSLQAKKEQLIEDMKITIKKEKEAWVQTKEQERAEAQQVGFKTGYDAGQEEAMKTYDDQLTQANHLAETARTDYLRTIAKHEKTIVQLSIATAEKILHQKLEEDEQLLLEIVKQGIDELKNRSEIAIYLAPAHYEFVMERKEELESLLEDDETISVYVHQKMSQGDCLIKHAYGQIDVGIDVQLQQIKAALEEMVAEN